MVYMCPQTVSEEVVKPTCPVHHERMVLVVYDRGPNDPSGNGYACRSCAGQYPNSRERQDEALLQEIRARMERSLTELVTFLDLNGEGEHI